MCFLEHKAPVRTKPLGHRYWNQISSFCSWLSWSLERKRKLLSDPSFLCSDWEWEACSLTVTSSPHPYRPAPHPQVHQPGTSSKLSPQNLVFKHIGHSCFPLSFLLSFTLKRPSNRVNYHTVLLKVWCLSTKGHALRMSVGVPRLVFKFYLKLSFLSQGIKYTKKGTCEH